MPDQKTLLPQVASLPESVCSTVADAFSAAAFFQLAAVAVKRDASRCSFCDDGEMLGARLEGTLLCHVHRLYASNALVPWAADCARLTELSFHLAGGRVLRAGASSYKTRLSASKP